MTSARTWCSRRPTQYREGAAAPRKKGEGLAAETRVKALQALLYRELTVNFEQTPARDVFEFLKTALGINIVVRYDDDAVGYGIDGELPISLSARKCDLSSRSFGLSFESILCGYLEELEVS